MVERKTELEIRKQVLVEKIFDLRAIAENKAADYATEYHKAEDKSSDYALGKCSDANHCYGEGNAYNKVLQLIEEYL